MTSREVNLLLEKGARLKLHLCCGDMKAFSGMVMVFDHATDGGRHVYGHLESNGERILVECNNVNPIRCPECGSTKHPAADCNMLG